MNNSKDSLTAEWLGIARRDWARIHLMLENDDVDAAALFLQQSIDDVPIREIIIPCNQ